MLEAIKKAIATSASLEELEVIESQLEELAQAISALQDEAEDRRWELEAEAHEEEVKQAAIREAEEEAKELTRTGAKIKDLTVTSTQGEAFVTKHQKTWEILLLNSYYSQTHYLALPSSTPEADVVSKCQFWIDNWECELAGETIWLGDRRVDISAEAIKKYGYAQAREKAISDSNN